MCKMCNERGKTWNGDDPKCAFVNGIFQTDNWNCATMSELRHVSRELETNMREDLTCGSIGYVPFEGDDYSGYIVMTWYKERGKTANAIIMGDADDIRHLTEQDALLAIDQFNGRSTV